MANDINAPHEKDGKGKGADFWWIGGLDSSHKPEPGPQFKADFLERIFEEYGRIASHAAFQKMDPSLAGHVLGAFDLDVIKRAVQSGKAQSTAHFDEAAALATILLSNSVQPLMAQGFLDRAKFLEEMEKADKAGPQDPTDQAVSPEGEPTRRTATGQLLRRTLEPALPSDQPAQPSSPGDLNMKAEKLPQIGTALPSPWTHAKLAEDSKHWPPQRPKTSEEARAAVKEVLFQPAPPPRPNPDIDEWLHKCSQTAQSSTHWLHKARGDQASSSAHLSTHGHSKAVKSSDSSRLPGLKTSMFETDPSMAQRKQATAAAASSTPRATRSREIEIDVMRGVRHEESSTILQDGQLCGAPSTYVPALGLDVCIGSESEMPGHVLKAKPTMPYHLNVPLISLDSNDSSTTKKAFRTNGNIQCSTRSKLVGRPVKSPPQRRRRQVYES